MNRIYNFSAGPATLPLEVLQHAQAEFLSFDESGMSIMEMSHRSTAFEQINAAAAQNVRDLLAVPDDYEVLFLQGGASLQFAMIPLNFLKNSADYVVTGTWGEKAVTEANKCGATNVVFSGKSSGYKTVPTQNELNFSAAVDFIHYTSNETIEGVEFKYDLDGGALPVVCDASSNFLSKPIDVSKYALIYAGAQKNLGPSGVCVVIIRRDLIDKTPENQLAQLDYKLYAANKSMTNTPNTWGIYFIKLVTDWLKSKGSLTAMQRENEAKAALLYDILDESDFYTGHAARSARSLMNVTFRLPSESLEKRFCAEAAEISLDGLKGHRSVGGVRASIYNAFPIAGVERLIEFMRDFERRSR